MRNLLQHGVAGSMPEKVVHLLEPVEVEQQKRKMPALSAAVHRGNFRFEPAGEAAAIGKPGKRIEVSEAKDILFRLLAFADITNGDHSMRFAAIIDASGDQFHGDSGSVVTSQFCFLCLSAAVGYVTGAFAEEVPSSTRSALPAPCRSARRCCHWR